MFYYLLYNSSFFKNGGSDKQIKLLIYGTILYIIFHGLIFSNQYLEKFQNYYWLLFALDMGSIYFIYKNSINGSLNINTKFYSENNSDNSDNGDNSYNNINGNKVNIDNSIRNDEDNKEVLKSMNNKLSNLKLSLKESERKNKKVSFNVEDKNETNLDDLENIKMEIKDTLMSNNKAKKTEIEKLNQIKKSITSESDTDFGSDIDLDAFEKTLD
mgnify:CR=1 FL=1